MKVTARIVITPAEQQSARMVVYYTGDFAEGLLPEEANEAVDRGRVMSTEFARSRQGFDLWLKYSSGQMMSSRRYCYGTKELIFEEIEM
jgi:hypothetical protein